MIHSQHKNIWQKALLMVCSLIVCLGALAATPAEIFENSCRKISEAKSLSANFTLQLNGSKIAGKLQAKGSKFALSSNATSSWYNGTDLYTHIASQNETTVFKPNAAQLAEANPLYYLKNRSEYKVMPSKTKTAGFTTVMLVPKKTGSSVKSITVQINEKTSLPVSIKVVTASGSSFDLKLSEIKLGVNIPDNTFEYPKSKYPKVKLTDMR